MTTQKPLTSIQIQSLIADVLEVQLEVQPEYDLALHYQLVEQIAALESGLREIAKRSLLMSRNYVFGSPEYTQLMALRRIARNLIGGDDE